MKSSLYCEFAIIALQYCEDCYCEYIFVITILIVSLKQFFVIFLGNFFNSNMLKYASGSEEVTIDLEIFVWAGHYSHHSSRVFFS